MIGLVMIVRDEEQAIDRCLSSVARIVSSYCIVDTGSSDRTRERIAAAMRGVAGTVHERPWRSFGENLTEAVTLAQASGARWLLRMDADMEVTHVHPGTWEWLAEDRDPTCDAWDVLLAEHWGTYRLPLLMRAGLEWRYEGVTHEGLYAERPVKTRPLLGFTITHHADGSGRALKYARDRELLEAELERNPGDPRTTFYLAESYRGLGLTEQAIAMYDARAAMAHGWEEEGWFAQYKAAQLREDVDALLNAHQRRPWRHEPLMAAARIVARDNRDDLLFIEAL